MDYAASPFDIKSLNDAGQIEGLLAGFGSQDRAGDVIHTKALSKSLAARGGRALPMLLHHKVDRPIGAWTEWDERSDGLFVKGRLSIGTRDGAEAYSLARDGALAGLSIGYITKAAQDDPRTGARHLLEIDLVEGSLVTVPCNPAAQVSSVKAITSVADVRELLRSAGLSGAQAKRAAGAAWGAITEADDDAEGEAEVKAIFEASAKRIAAMAVTDGPAPGSTFNWS